MDSMPGAATYPIRAVARMTGLSTDTLRAWERRYEAVVPARGARGRVYSDAHIERLRLLAALVEGGHAIGTIAGLSDAALRKLHEPGSSAAAVIAPQGDDTLQQALDRYDIAAIEATLTRHALLLPPPALIFSVILPALRDVGARWEAGAICTAHEHLMSSTIRNVLGGLLRSLMRETSEPGIVFATPAGQRHELGLLCAAVLAAWHGHPVLYLGPDVPGEDIARAVTRVKARTLVLSSTVEQGDERGDLKDLRGIRADVGIVTGGARADALRGHLGSRARAAATLEDFRHWLSSHA